MALRRRTEAAPRAATPVDEAPEAASLVSAPLGGVLDRTLALQVEETLALLPIKRRRMLLRYIETGNARQAVVEAGYNVKSPKTATEVGREILASPTVQHALEALLEARGLGGRKLDEIHAIHLARHSSPDGGDRDRSLRAVALARKYTTPHPRPAPVSPLTAADRLLGELSDDELDTFATTGRLPGRLRSRLRPDAIPAPADPPLVGPTADAVAPPSVAPSAARDEEDDPEPQPAHPVTTCVLAPGDPRQGLASSSARERPEDRCWPPRAPDNRGADLLAEMEQLNQGVPRDWCRRDRLW